MKVLGLISSLTDPASRARIIQYKDYFAASGNTLAPRFFTPLKDADPAPWTYKLKKITGINEWTSFDLMKTIGRVPLHFAQAGFDLIWQNRLIQLHHSYWETKLRKPVVFDFDDAIWFNEGEKEVIKKIQQSAMIFAGNEYLADYASKYNKNTFIIPTTVDTTKLFPLKKKASCFTIGWIGTKSNFQYLEIMKSAVLDFLLQNQDACLVIVSSEKPDQFNFDDKQIIFRYWNQETENLVINEFSVGLMPLADTEWTKGKCSYKMLQYMACGKPVIVSPVGMNNKLLTADTIGVAANNTVGWLNAFNTLKNDNDFHTTCSLNGRNLVEKNYSVAIYTPVIINHFKKLLG